MKNSETAKSRNEVYISDTLTIPVSKISYVLLSENGKYTCKTTEGGSFQINSKEYEKLTNFLGNKNGKTINKTGSSGSA